ncbi:MAG: diguanylate cyclase domain-containing protein [Leptospirales bacterium]
MPLDGFFEEEYNFIFDPDSGHILPGVQPVPIKSNTLLSLKNFLGTEHWKTIQRNLRFHPDQGFSVPLFFMPGSPPISLSVQGKIEPNGTRMAAGKISGWTGIVEKIQDLSHKEHLYEKKMEGLNEGLLELDPEDRILYATPMAEKLLGYKNTSLSGLPFGSLLHDGSGTLLELETLRSESPLQEQKVFLRKKNGELLPVNLNMISIKATPSLPKTSMIASFRDRSNQLENNLPEETEEEFIKGLTFLEQKIDRQLHNQVNQSTILSEVSEHLLKKFRLSLCCFLRLEPSGKTPGLISLSGITPTLTERFKSLLKEEISFQSQILALLQGFSGPSQTIPHPLLLPFESLPAKPELTGRIIGLNPSPRPRQDFLLLFGKDHCSPRKLNQLHHFAERIGISLLRHDEMERSRMQLSAMMASLTPMLIADQNGRVEWSNAAFEELTGFLQFDSVDRTSLAQADLSQTEFYHRLRQCVQKGSGFSGEVTDQKLDGTDYTTELRITPVRQGDGSITHYIAVLTDITDRKAKELRLQQWAFYDTLTGLPNRFLLNLILEKEIARTDRSNKGIAVCFIDLDGFKPINDQFGHETGDKILEAISDRLESVVRRGDVVGRLGGDEFVCLLPGIGSRPVLEKILERVLLSISAPFGDGEKRVSLRASIGVSLYTNDPVNDPKELIHQADQAMYEAKRMGGNRFEFFMDLPASQDYSTLGRIG